MKEKIIYTVLAIVFIAVLIGISLGTGKKAEKTKVEAENAVIPVTSANFEKEVLNSDKRVLVDFYADWCGPCRMMAPIVEEISEEVEGVEFYKVNCDDEQELAAKYEVMTIPTLLILRKGEQLKEFIGVTDKDEIIEALNNLK